MPDPTTRPGLDRYPSIHTRELEPARALVARAYGELALDLADDPRRFEWRASLVDLGPVVIVPSATRGKVLVHGAVQSYLLHLLSQGGAHTVTRHEEVDLAGGRSAALLSPGVPVRWTSNGRTASSTLRLAPRFVVAQLEALTGVTVRRPPTFALPVATGAGPGAGVERLCLFLLDELSRGSDALTHPAVVTSLCEALVRALLVGQPHDLAHLLEKPAPPSSRGVVRLVEAYLEAHAGEPVRVADLPALTGASVRSIEAAFRAHQGTTPGAFLRDRRLDLARRRLLSPDAETTVTSVAHAAGFLRVEHFEAAYAGRFGERPAETRRHGHIALGGATTAERAEPAADEARVGMLSPREREVCAHAARGMLNKQIAVELGISERTVKAHRARGMEKLGAGSAAELGRMLRGDG
jgi:DNA-binding CsgD family transcriptional regulator/AraC-like DNA-binding protein